VDQKQTTKKQKNVVKAEEMVTNQDFWKRVKYSFYATLIFLIVTNPITFNLTKAVTKGIPSVTYFVHAALFFLLSLATMMIPNL
jgi:hypothetical protein